MGKTLAFLFGVVSYLVFFATFLYSIGFVGNVLVPKSIDSGEPGSLTTALLVNSGLLALFAIQHSVMARLKFKEWWTRIVPSAIERSIYVLLTSLLLILMYWQWQPMTSVIWSIQNEIAAYAVWGIYFLGWAVVLVSTFLINHFELFGLAQVYRYFSDAEFKHSEFRMPFLYGLVRHPIMLGFIIAFWAAPTMTAGRLLFAVATTAYILIALHFEEKDLVEMHGEEYQEYQQSVSMIIPLPKSKKTG